MKLTQPQPQTKTDTRRTVCRAVALIAILLLMILYISGIASFSSQNTFGLSVTRAMSSVAFIAIIISDGIGIWNVKLRKKELLFSLPAIFIAVNNFPWISLLTGDVSVTGGANEIFLLAAECLLIGIFEETAFRGIIITTVLERFSETKKQVFLSVLITSAAFGVAHIFNLAAGAGFLPTLQQVGYSFLIGGMCALVLIKTRSLPLCIFIHALYDFCGFLIPRLGVGTMWTVPEIVFTAAASVIIFAFYIRTMFDLNTNDVDFLKNNS